MGPGLLVWNWAYCPRLTLFTGVLQPLIGHVADKQGKRKLILSFGFFIGGSGLLGGSSAIFWFITVVSLRVG